MEITEVRIKLMEDSDDRLQAFCSITFDNAFVVRDVKIIEGVNGLFVAMPSRKLTSHCPNCSCKNHLRARFCNQCGASLSEDREIRDSQGRTKLYADIAHPINSECREMIQRVILDEFEIEVERAQQPGYVSRYDDEFDDDYLVEDEDENARDEPSPSTPAARPPESTHIQPPETQPRGPHKPPSRQRTQHPPGKPRSSSQDDFGAGIF